MGLISRDVIRSWLENYQGLLEDSKGVDDMPRNSGCKPDDGITGTMLNRVILAQGLKSMRWEAEILHSCCRARWIDKDGFMFTLRRLGLSKDQYYKRCDWAIDYLYYHVNGFDADRRGLLAKLDSIDAL